LAKNVPPAHFLRVVPIDKGAFDERKPPELWGSLPCQREVDRDSGGGIHFDEV